MSHDARKRVATGANAEWAAIMRPCVGDSSMSLAFALQAIVLRGGCEAAVDDVAAALGLPFMTCALPGEEDLSRWPLHARDALLVEAGRLFGIDLRAVHPPDAALGLDRAPEYLQHFQASYRPLILRALEHRQPTLAWRGWPGDRSGLWGIISDTSSKGIGLCGYTMTPDGDPASNATLVLDSPPVQFYVAETVAALNPEPAGLVDALLEHALRALGNELNGLFGVVTGPAAYDAWIARLINAGGGPGAAPDPAIGHRRMASAEVAGRQSAMRFLQGHGDAVAGGLRSLLGALTESCHDTVTALSESTDLAVVAEALKTTAGRRKLAEQVATARAAATKALIAVQSWAKTNKAD